MRKLTVTSTGKPNSYDVALDFHGLNTRGLDLDLEFRVNVTARAPLILHIAVMIEHAAQVLYFVMCNEVSHRQAWQTVIDRAPIAQRYAERLVAILTAATGREWDHSNARIVVKGRG